MVIGMEEVIFYILSVLAVLSAIFALEAKDNIYAVLGLGSMMLDIAAIFILMQSYFLGLIQLIVYAGTVTILMIIAIMLIRATKAMEGYEQIGVDLKYEVATIILTLASLAVVGITIIQESTALEFKEIGMTELGKLLFGSYWIVFVLVMFLVGAIVGGAFAILSRGEVEKK